MDDDGDNARFRRLLSKVVYEELELRTGMLLTSGMSEKQLEEFEALIDRDVERLGTWLRSNSPNFEGDPDFKKMELLYPDEADALELVAEYAATKWLAYNRPDYKDIVRSINEKLSGELTEWARSYDEMQTRGVLGVRDDTVPPRP